MAETHIKKTARPNYISIAITLLLVLALGYIVVDKYDEGQKQRYDSAFEQGVIVGEQQALSTILAEVNTNGQAVITVPMQDNRTAAIPLIAQQAIITALNDRGFFALTAVGENDTQVEHQLITAAYCGQLLQQQ